MDRRARTDIVLALLLTISGLVEAVVGLTGAPAPWYVVATVPLATLPVGVRRSHTVLAILVLDATLLVQAVLGSDLPGGFTEMIVLLLVVYAVGSRTTVPTTAVLLVTTLAVLATVIAVGEAPHPANFAYMAVVVGAAWAAGIAVSMSEERGALLAERRAMTERARIAGELHDVVSHSVSAIVVQAAAERRDQSEDSPVAQTLTDIEQHGRATLTELRRLLGVLRIDGAEPPRAPQPGITDIVDLVGAADATRVQTELRVEGRPVPLGEGVSLAAYRVVQEALTNVRKHSAASTATVTVRWLPSMVDLEVHDPGPARHVRHVPGGGFGLRGMEERVRTYGGTVQADPVGAGFRVRARLPIDAPAGEVG
jgi:signal transduction histidine kinase